MATGARPRSECSVNVNTIINDREGRTERNRERASKRRNQQSYMIIRFPQPTFPCPLPLKQSQTNRIDPNNNKTSTKKKEERTSRARGALGNILKSSRGEDGDENARRKT